MTHEVPGPVRPLGGAAGGEVRADVDRRGAALAGDGRDHILRLAAPDGERPAVLAQLRIQVRRVRYKKAMRGAPDGRRSASSSTNKATGAILGGGQQRRVITQPQVTTEPQHGCGHQLGTHLRIGGVIGVSA